MSPQDMRHKLIVNAAALVTVMYAFFLFRIRMSQASRPCITYAPMSAMDEERQKNLNKIYNCDDVECVNMLRMRRTPFFTLCTVLRERNLLRDSIHSSVEEQLAMFLHVVGHNQRFRVIHSTWRRSVETVSRYFKEVLYAIGELRHEMIKAPSNETPLKITNSSRWYPYFKDCIGAIDGTHFHARVPAKMQSAFRVAMRWTNVMSSFLLRRMCELISSGVRTDKGFKEVHLNQVAKAINEFTGQEVTGTQVYNHLRKWRQRWIRVTKLKELSGALLDQDNFMIPLEEEHYKGHIKAHPKDADLLNKPIENYQQMQVIFCNGLATGKYAIGSTEPLGSPSEFVDNSFKLDGDGMKLDDVSKLFGDVAGTGVGAGASGNGGGGGGAAASGNGGGGGGAAAGSKRKRAMLSEDDISIMVGMTDVVNNVADAIRETKVHDVHPGLYEAVMFVPGFSDEELMVAYSHLLDNKAQGTGFVKMTDSHRVLWLRTFLAKHYYN